MQFDVRPTQVSTWKNMVQRCGDEALKSRKDKASESMKHTKKELYYARMDRDIAKKSSSSVQSQNENSG